MAPFALDRTGGQPLFLQIYEILRHRIISGRVPAGGILPPSRRLAVDLGVSRSTAIAAYDQLVAEGYVESRLGAGIFVNALPEAAGDFGGSSPGGAKAPERPFAVGSAPLDPPPFRPGIPDMSRFPFRAWARAVARAARQAPEAMVLATDPFGDPVLRQAIAGHVRSARGIEADADRIVITAGAIGGLDFILRTIMKPGDRLALEDPGYQAVRAMARTRGLEPLWLPVDRDGAVVPASGGGLDPVAAMLTPSHEYPLGGTMPMARRTEFLNYAGQTGAWLIEDDFDSDFRYAGRPIPALSSLDDRGRVIYVGTFAKLFSQSLRIGYVILPSSLVDRFRQAVPPFGAGASLVPQRALAAFIESGELQRHVRRMRRVYGVRRAHFVALLREILGARISFDDHPVGMQLVARLAPGVDDRAVSAAAEAAAIDCPPLSGHYAEMPPVSGLLMGFAAFETGRMAAPMETLRTVLDRISPTVRA